MENKIKHLEFIQKLIERFANNSFELKRWAVTVSAGILALGHNELSGKQYLVSFIPVITFWILDGFYLFKERLYRALFNEVRVSENDNASFSLETAKLIGGKNTWFRAIMSRTILTFYLALLISMTLIIFLIR